MPKIYTCIPDHACNNHCLFCTRPNDPKTHNMWGFVPFKKTNELFEEFAKIRSFASAIILSGGEPALRPDFFKLLEKLIELDFCKVQVQTNGRLFSNKEFCERTVSVLGNRGEFFVSFHAPNEKLFEELSGVKGSFNETVLGLKNLIELNARIRTDTVVVRQNYKDLAVTVDFLASLGVKGMELIFVHPNGRAWENRERIVPRIEETVPFVKEAVNRGICNGILPVITRYPFCVLGDYAKHAVEFHYSEDFDNYLNARVKGAECQKCKYFKNCPGIWTNYLKIFKFDFLPLD